MAPPPSVSIAAAAESRILAEARTLLDQQACEAAARLLDRHTLSGPPSPVLLETWYLLAQCYEREGRTTAALTLYDRLAQLLDAPHHDDVLERTRQLRRALPTSARQSVSGLLVQAETLPRPPQLERWVQTRAASGVTTLILNVAAERPPAGPRRTGSQEVGVYFRTTLAPVVRDVLTELIPIAHREGLRIFGALALDRMDWIRPELGWYDVQYQVGGGTRGPSPQLDLFHPGLREYLTGLLADLADTGLDGIVLRFTAQPSDGFGRYAADAFLQDFQVPLDPNVVFGRPDSHQPGAAAPHAPTETTPSPHYWRWVGWKSREHMRVLNALVASTRRRSPVPFVLELHAEALTDPLLALVRYGEDILDAKRSAVQYLLLTGTNGSASTGRLLDRAREVLGGVDRLWLLRSRPSAERAAVPPEIGVIVDDRP